MERSFIITFDFEISPSRYMRLNAEVEMHVTESYYIIHNISNSYNPVNIPVIPDITIKAVRNHKGGIIWVQIDSGTETMLSSIVGKAIENSYEFQISNK